MLSKFHTVYEGGEAEIIEKKSRFIATVLPVTCEEEALEFIESMKKKYWNATHNCYAYVSDLRHKDAVMTENRRGQQGNRYSMCCWGRRYTIQQS